ncbi:MAG: hypothetical protein KGZ25_08215, partial [Planctomycetes bacterium]|nr:hypothetical protein [Planctomycetota bacterium]
LPVGAQTFLTWDEENFYLGMRTQLLPGQTLRRRMRRDESNVHRDDSIEICFDPLGRDQAEPAFYQAIFNSLGFCWDAAHTVGVAAKFWNGNWTVKSDYERGMDHWDIELKIPVSSMEIKTENEPGQVWRFLACRDWKNMETPDGRGIWNIYSSITGWGGFVYADSYAGLVLDDAAPTVQLVDIEPLWHGKLGFEARLHNPTDQPIKCNGIAKVFFNMTEGAHRAGTDIDWTTRTEKPLRELSKKFELAPGESAIWKVPSKDLPALPKNKRWYDMVLTVKSQDGKVTYYRAQRHFLEKTLKAKVRKYKLPLSVEYNPVRSNLEVRCDVLDYPKRGQTTGVKVEVFPQGAETIKPLAGETVTHIRNKIYEGVVDLPKLKIGKYAIEATVVGKDGEALERKNFEIEKLNEEKEFAWWGCKAGILEEPVPPHKPLEYAEKGEVVTTMGEVTFDKSAFPLQIEATGERLLDQPVRLLVGGKGPEIRGTFKTEKQTALQAEIKGAEMVYRGQNGQVMIRTRTAMEYDGCMKFTVDIEPKRPTRVDSICLEIPFELRRAQFLWTMAQDCRASWLAVPIGQGNGKVWDSSKRKGFQMTVGTFMPQYVVTDGLRGLCWFADSDRGWVPTDDVPATEVIQEKDCTLLRFNLIGKPFMLRDRRRVTFYLLPMPPRPMPPGWRLYHRNATQFGYYVHDPIVCWKPPMPKDFQKAQNFMEKGTLYNKDGSVKVKEHGGKWHPGREFAPWHNSHDWYRVPAINTRTFSYFRQECGDVSWTPTMIDYKCYLWNEYVRRTDIAGIYFDMPEAMGFSFSVSNGTAYVIPAGQPHAGEVQPGYRISGFREFMKRVRGIFYQHGRPYPWLEMHSTHGPVAPCTPFLDIRTEGEHYRMPSGHHFMRAWTLPHLRTIDVPPMWGMVTRWLSGYPWDGEVRGADPQRCKIGALILHDVFTGWGGFGQSGRIYKRQAPSTRKPPYGYRHPNVSQKLIAHGMNRSEVVYYPYWNNSDVVRIDWLKRMMLEGVRASLWHIPSRDKVLVAVANFNESLRSGVRVMPALKKLGLEPIGAEERLLVVDFETGEPLKAQPELDLEPLDFRLLMFAKVKVAKDAQLEGKNYGGAEVYDPAKHILTDKAIRADLAMHGLVASDARYYGPETVSATADISAASLEGIEVSVTHAPDDNVALALVENKSAHRRDIKVKLKLDKLGLKPAGAGDNFLVMDVRTGNLLQETAYNARGEVRVLSRRHRRPGEVSVRVPGKGGMALLLYANQ